MIANNRVAFQGSPSVMQTSEVTHWYSSSFTGVQTAQYVSIFPRHRRGFIVMMNWIGGVGRSTLSRLSDLGRATLILVQAILVDQTSVFIGV